MDVLAVRKSIYKRRYKNEIFLLTAVIFSLLINIMLTGKLVLVKFASYHCS